MNTDFTSFLDALMESIDKENIDLYKKLFEGKSIDTSDPEKLFFSLLYPFENLVEGIVKSEVCNDTNVVFIYKHYNFIESNFVKLIERIEGHGCSADKSRTIVKGLVNYFKIGTPISFNYDQEYTFHLPKKVFNTHESIVGFYEALLNLYYGNSEKYLHFLRDYLLQFTNNQGQ